MSTFDIKLDGQILSFKDKDGGDVNSLEMKLTGENRAAAIETTGVLFRRQIPQRGVRAHRVVIVRFVRCCWLLQKLASKGETNQVDNENHGVYSGNSKRGSRRAEHMDPIYLYIIILGGVVGLAGIFFAWRERRAGTRTGPNKS